MKQFSYPLALVFAALLLFTACKKENEGPLIFISPDAVQFYAEPGDFVEFVITMSSDVDLDRLRITRNLNSSVTQTVLDTALTGTEQEVTYVYQVPTNGVTSVFFVFELTDIDGRSIEMPRRIFVEGSALLTETTGHQLYSIHAGNDANRYFHISSASADQDTTDTDVRDYDELDNDTLSRQWTSGNGLLFASFDENGYDYAQATFNSAKNSYEGAVKTQIVSDIEEGDKIIVKYSEDPEAYAIFDIIEIFDEPGAENDRYRFNMKK